jgi:hypothetical protein
VPIREPAFVKPDPLLYAQYFLSSLGLAVTWDNPDIEVRLGGAPVASSQLLPGTQYDIVARIWNGSLFAPVVQMPVHFSYLDFGIGTKRTPITSTKVDLGVKGGPNHPALATVPWTTPDIEGHYCLLVELDPFDDLNPLNNLGQENVLVGRAHSPADFRFTLRNDSQRTHRYQLEVDGYLIPELGTCHEREESRTRLRRHQRGAHPLPSGWLVVVSPDSVSLDPDESVSIEVSATPPSRFRGAQAVNVNAFHEDGLAGGVTLRILAE